MWPPTHRAGGHRSGDHWLGARPAGCGRPRTEPVITPARPGNPPPAERAPAPHGTWCRGRSRFGPRGRARASHDPGPGVDLKASIRCLPCAGGNGTTAGRVAPSGDGPVGNWRASGSGTAATVTTGSVVPPTQPRPQRGRSRRAGGMRGRQEGRARPARSPGRGRRANPTFHGQVDPMGVAGEVATHGVDLTMQQMRSTRPERAGDPAGPSPGPWPPPTSRRAADRARPGARPRLVIVGWVHDRPDVAAQAPSR